MVKRVLSVLILCVFLILAVTAQVMAADKLQTRDQIKLHLRDGSCLAADRDRLMDKDRDHLKLQDGSCRLVA